MTVFIVVVRTGPTPGCDNSPELDDPPEYDQLSVLAELEPVTNPLEFEVPTLMSVPPTYPEEPPAVSEHHQGQGQGSMIGKPS